MPSADSGAEIGTAADETSDSTFGLGTMQGRHFAARASIPWNRVK